MDHGQMKVGKSYILLDVGGTQIKAGVSSDTEIGAIRSFPSCAKEDKETVLKNFACVIMEMAGQAAGRTIAGVGMAFPGPFDYAKGISLMKGLDKYDSIYGCPIEEEIKKRAEGLWNAGFCFLHDVEAFAVGECWYGEARNAEKVLCLCIGTGIGSAFVHHRVVLKKEDGIPENGWIYDYPYKESVIDDYLSVRGLGKLAIETFGKFMDGKELYELCGQGSTKARKVFQLFGQDFKLCIEPFLDSFQPDAVVLGGQISNSFCYFGEAFGRECNKRGIKILFGQDTSKRAMQGLLMTMKRRTESVKS